MRLSSYELSHLLLFQFSCSCLCCRNDIFKSCRARVVLLIVLRSCVIQNVIFDVIGTPSWDDMEHVTNSKAKSYLKTLPPKPRSDFAVKFPSCDPGALDLLQKMLQFDPAKRISVKDAIKHPFFNLVRQPQWEVRHNVCTIFMFSLVRLIIVVLQGGPLDHRHVLSAFNLCGVQKQTNHTMRSCMMSHVSNLQKESKTNPIEVDLETMSITKENLMACFVEDILHFKTQRESQ
jgi:serine/threonine protein kinase